MIKNMFNKEKNIKMKKEIPIFTATDDNYVPYLAVTLQSMIDNASKNYNYSIKILNTGISEDNIQKIKKYERENVSIEFVNVMKSLEEIGLRLHTCIYYTQTTYYRLFISSLYPQYDKVLYLDCDIVVRGDISKLYNINIGDNLVGATTDQFVMSLPRIQPYFVKCLGLDNVTDYFNAGVLIMNLKQFRLQNFEEQFVDLLAKYKFIVQDQDYLNVICKGKVHYINGSWDKMPCKDDMDLNKINLIHYNLIWKPWHAETIYDDEFWKYAEKTEYYDFIKGVKDNYTKLQYEQEVANFEGFMDRIVADIDNPNNYYNLYVKPTEDDGVEMFEAVEGVLA